MVQNTIYFFHAQVNFQLHHVTLRQRLRRVRRLNNRFSDLQQLVNDIVQRAFGGLNNQYVVIDIKSGLS
eukprot:scaffold37.g4393.t1